VGATRWTRRNPPNYVERSHFLLGRTVDSGRVWDIVATARGLRERHGDRVPVYLAGEGTSAALAAYAGLLEQGIAGFLLWHPPATHMDEGAPVLLNVLRVLDIPQAIGLLAPRPVTLDGSLPESAGTVAHIYQAAGAPDRLTVGQP
jgi:hypothetical protein